MDFNPLLYNEKYRIPTNRLTDVVYATGFYHIVICTKDRWHFFGNIYDDTMHFTKIGDYANKCIICLPEHFPDAVVHRFQVMPNHIHILLQITESEKEYTPNQFKKAGRLAVIVRTFKAAVSRWAKENNIDFGWQSRYYDNIIRSANQYSETDYYIQNNVLRWAEDKMNND